MHDKRGTIKSLPNVTPYPDCEYFSFNKGGKAACAVLGSKLEPPDCLTNKTKACAFRKEPGS